MHDSLTLTLTQTLTLMLTSTLTLTLTQALSLTLKLALTLAMALSRILTLMLTLPLTLTLALSSLCCGLQRAPESFRTRPHERKSCKWLLDRDRSNENAAFGHPKAFARARSTEKAAKSVSLEPALSLIHI